MRFPFGDTVTVLRRVVGDPDRYGNATFTFVTSDVTGCAFDPGVSTETPQTFRQAVNTQPTLYMPPGTPIDATCQLVVRGLTYDVDGDPGDYVNPFTGWHPGIVVKLTRTEG